MKNLLSVALVALFSVGSLLAQSGCPGCVIKLPANLPADTLYLPPLPQGERGKPYNADLAFRVPKSTTPVSKVDSTTPPGLPISRIEIVSVENLPPGIQWQANKTVFETANETDGCFKMCGTPLKADSFVLKVKLRATVLIFTQETSFNMDLIIKPPISVNKGFTMTNAEDCGATTVTFTNNIPSKGKSGFTYEWDFGDGTKFKGENPPPHLYSKPGMYVVTYKARIDTVGHILTGVTLLGLGCTDLLNAPDPYLRILRGTQILLQNNHVNNVVLPYTFNMYFPLQPQVNYTLEVWDEDSGIDLSDDLCGSLPFNTQSGGDTLVSGGLRLLLKIENPVDEITATDTVIVLPPPPAPVLTASQKNACPDEVVILQSSYTTGPNQWLRNGQPIPGASKDFIYLPTQSGTYQVQIVDSLGCIAISAGQTITFYNPPAEPVFLNDRNNLILIDTTALPKNYALQWYSQGAPIPGATGFRYCARVSGTYALQVTDLATGCTNRFTMTVTVNPNFDCTVSTQQPDSGVLLLYPNPTSGAAWIRLEEALTSEAQLRIWDASGRLLQQRPVAAGSDQVALQDDSLRAGVYFVELHTEGRCLRGRLVVMR
ncbi:MAG: T9SS type A sorting domain-containing protein [Saprospiraceae bacterium]|nr:T9SS type A sorting domain-containing protein [Saprospiraceae bacterium]MDW8229545.1 T9SS type A sorting domain-containing protein [Saprospiraceae bacterium]